MIFTIYFAIAAIAFFIALGYLWRSMKPWDEVYIIILSSLVMAFLWPAVLSGIVFDYMGRR